MSHQPDVVRRLLPQQMADRRDAHAEATLQEAELASTLYYSAPAPYKDAREHADWKARLAALQTLAEPLSYALHDCDPDRVKATVRHFLDNLNEMERESPLAPSLLVEYELEAREQQAQVRDLLRLTPAERRFWRVAWWVIGACLALLVLRNWPGICDWEGWR